MAMKDISDREVLQACKEWLSYEDTTVFADAVLRARTGQSYKVIQRCLERAVNRGLLEYGLSLRTAWLTPKGEEYLANEDEEQ